MLIGQTVYKKEGSSLANYMKYNYKYDDNKRMIESQTMKWNSNKNNWENDLLVRYTYEGILLYVSRDTKKDRSC